MEIKVKKKKVNKKMLNKKKRIKINNVYIHFKLFN